MVEKILRDSLERNWTVVIFYQKGSEVTQRSIDVKSIAGDKVVAYCHLRHQTRIFSINSILAADYCRKGKLH